MEKFDIETYEEICLRQAQIYATWWMMHYAIQCLSQVSRIKLEKRMEDKNE